MLKNRRHFYFWEVEGWGQRASWKGCLIEMIPTGRGGSYVKLNQPHGWEEKQLITFFVFEVKIQREVKS